MVAVEDEGVLVWKFFCIFWSREIELFVICSVIGGGIRRFLEVVSIGVFDLVVG